MAIGSHSKDEFGKKLGVILSASHPIQSVEQLKGRDSELKNIGEALYAPGRHIFIYGDRGVGKSSLAATAAFQYQSSDAQPIFVSGSTNDTFATIIANIACQALSKSRTETIKKTKSLGFELRGLKIGWNTEHGHLDIANQIRSVGDAVELLKQIADQYAEKPVVVIDEFDTIKDVDQRNLFASLLKQLGDRMVNLKFIFTGIGKSLDELLGAHSSAYRQLETVELPRLGWDARREIVLSAADAFGLNVDNDVNFRIAAVSDGFPYYVHVITEKMLWQAFDDEVAVTELDWEHFHRGLMAAILSINAELRRPYERAVLQRPEEFEDVVWATADREDLFRSLNDMYESYQVVAVKRTRQSPFDRKKFTDQVRRLKDKGYGEILQQEQGRPGWYSYREKMLRGYVRMQAEAHGVELTGERLAPKQLMHVGNVRSGYHGPTTPRGVNITRQIRGDKETK